MYIQPNTVIKILQGVPLDNTYKHTIYFSNKTAQQTYFNTKVVKTFTNLSYQRVNRSVCRLPICADEIYNCNYMMFQNTSFGNKFFYAFITGVEYVSNDVCEVQFEIDVIQTWQTDIQFKECYVVREHAMSDNIGDNTQPETLAIGNKTFYNQGNYVNLNDQIIVTYSTVNLTGDDAGDLVEPILRENNIMTTVPYITELDNLTGLVAIVNKANELGKLDAIIGIYQIPRLCTKLRTDDALQLDVEVDDAYGDYTPRNKKLYTSQFCEIIVDDSHGNSSSYYFEKIATTGGEQHANKDLHVVIEGTTAPTPYVYYYPLSYSGRSRNYGEGKIIDNFTQVTVNADALTNYIAQNKNSMALGLIGDCITSMIGAPTALVGFGNRVGNTVGKLMDVNNQPPKTLGQRNNNGYLNKFDNNKIYGMIYALDRPSVERMDKFFDAFGYATNTTKTPNISGRPAWNYVQTNGCIAVGNAPADDIAKICSIMDDGITWWKSGAGVGNYSQNNSIS